eukprot:TRINITY_DN7091_c0_g1_i1.p1 TRINITY_DN7091_c0_g1~~TRINITY_DN7091_c0_g1_i1.p1  ORF type:complete len:179 (-),score=10.44 TRINITY_DN7091_c0_g1_i1:644-1180(-)
MAMAVLNPRDCLPSRQNRRHLRKFYGADAQFAGADKPPKGKSQNDSFDKKKRADKNKDEPSSASRRHHSSGNQRRGNDSTKKLWIDRSLVPKREKENPNPHPSRVQKESPETLASPTRFFPGSRGTERWAGPAYANSPSPRSLPLPSFSLRNCSNDRIYSLSVNILATRDLKRLLGLE